MTLIIINLFQSSVPKCTSRYPLQETYALLDKDHTWKYWLLSEHDIRVNYPQSLEFLKKYEPETFIEIASYMGTVEDGINIAVFFKYRKQLDKIENYVYVDSVRSGEKEGLRYAFSDGTLEYVYEPSKEIKISFHENKPSIIEISNTDGTMMTVVNDGSPLRGMTLDDKHEIQTGLKDCFYRSGEKLFKWPNNDDFCIARIFDDNKAIELPLYFDINEFEKIERKIHETKL